MHTTSHKKRTDKTLEVFMNCGRNSGKMPIFILYSFVNRIMVA